MAFPTALNSQITDSVTQANVKVLADSPALSSAELYVATSQALSNAAHNATVIQQQASVTSQAGLTAGVGNLLSMSTASGGVGTSQVAGVDGQLAAERAEQAAMAATVAATRSRGLR